MESEPKMDAPEFDTAVRRPRSALAGPAAALLFVISLFGFALVRNDGYSHGTKAVSELGAVGAENALAFNLLGFVVPGALVIVLATAMLRSVGPPSRPVGPIFLALSGLATLLAGVAPVDMEARGSPLSIAHLAAAMLSGLFWTASLFWTGPMLRRRFSLQLWGRITPWFTLFMVANIAWQVAFAAGAPVLPGYGQRLGFLAYFGWVAVTGWLIATGRGSRSEKQTVPTSA